MTKNDALFMDAIFRVRANNENTPGLNDRGWFVLLDSVVVMTVTVAVVVRLLGRLLDDGRLGG